MSRPGAVLGVDGGSTKTHMALADGAGRLLAFVAGPGSNHEGIGYPAVASIMRRLFKSACSRARVRPGVIRRACFGLCGCDLPEDEREIQRRVVKSLGLGGRALVRNDAYLAIFNDRWRKRGVGVTCGGWHKWVAVDGSKVFMHEGSTHPGIRWLATQELLAVYEGFRPPSAYARDLVRWLGFRDVDEYVERWHYGGWKRPFIRPPSAEHKRRSLRIPEWVGRRAARGDRRALAVLGEYGHFVARGVAAAAGRLGISRGGFDVVLSGSVLANIRPLQRAVRFHARRLVPAARIRPAAWKPVRGALNQAAHAAWGGFAGEGPMDRILLYGTGS